MRAAVLLLTGCSLPSSDPREPSKTVEESLPVEDTAPWGQPATGVTATAQIELDPSVVDLGHMPIGDAFELQIAIMNVGHADLEIESVSFLTTDPGDLTMEPIETPFVVPWGELREATIRFAPTDEGEDHCILAVQSDDPVNPEVRAEVVGDGVAGSDTGA